MNYDLLFAIIFYGFVLLFLMKNKHKVEVQNKIFFLYKTKLGINLMNRIADKFPRLLRIIGYFSILTGISGMFFISYILIKGTIKLVLDPSGTPSLAPVLPGVSIPGAPNLSFWHWIITIFIVAVVHEFSHGVFARLNKVEIKSSGFALLGPLLAAFVEPNETKLNKLKKRNQIAIFSAGPFANIVLGFLFLILSIALIPVQNNLVSQDEVIIDGIIEGYPAEELEIETPFRILAIDNQPTLNKGQFFEITSDLKPEETIKLSTDKGDFSLTLAQHPRDETKGFMGITFLQQHLIMEWINLLIMWLFIINLGIGLFNLLPLGPVDGGRIFYVTSLFFIKSEQKAKKIWGYVSFIFLVLLFINLLPWIVKFLIFIAKPIIFLISFI